jgi:hypothetical protein
MNVPLIRLPVWSFLLFIFLSGCAWQSSQSPESAPVPEQVRLSRHMYYTEGKLVFLLVNTFPSTAHFDEEFVPLEIAVANKSLKALTINPEEGITLRRRDGHAWPAASLQEHARLKMRSDFDRRLDPNDLLEIMNTRYSLYRYMAPNFGFASRTRLRDRYFSRVLTLPKYAYTVGYVLVTNPGGPEALAGQTYELWLSSPELEDPVFATFTFPHRRVGTDKPLTDE